MPTASQTPLLPPARLPLPRFPAERMFGAHRTLIRPLQADDAGRLIEFFGSHTYETIYQRYGYAFRQMSAEHAARLVNVDQTRDAALGVFELAPGCERLIAVGRYCLDRSGRVAEVAFVVHERRRRLGIASTLLHLLADIARERGLEALVAQVQHDNAAMLSVFRAFRGEFTAIAGTGCVFVRIALHCPAIDRAPPRRESRPASEDGRRTAVPSRRQSVRSRRFPSPVSP